MRRPLLALLAVVPAAAAAAHLAGAPATAAASSPAPAAARAQASPRDTARGTVAGAKLMVDYGRPSVRGRTIFAATGLVPFGQVWRTGANAATTLVADRDVMIGATRVPAGTYTLYTIPQAGAWQLVVNRQTGQWGTEYDQGQDLARIPMTVSALRAPVEQFTILVQPQALVMRWASTQASVSLRAVTPGRSTSPARRANGASKP